MMFDFLHIAQPYIYDSHITINHTHTHTHNIITMTELLNQ